MKFGIAILLFILSAYSCISIHGQNQEKIDSLHTVLKTAKADSTRVNTYIALCDSYRGSNSDTAMYFGNLGLMLALKAGYKKETASAYNRMGALHHSLGRYDSALVCYSNSLKILEEILAASKDKKDSVTTRQGMSNNFNSMGLIHSERGSYDKAIELYLKALKIYEESGNSPEKGIAFAGKKGMSSCYANIGNVYYYQGTFDKAMMYHLKSLKIFGELLDGCSDKKTGLVLKKGLSACYNNIGNVYYSLGRLSRSEADKKQAKLDYSNAINYYYKSLKIQEELSDKNGISICCSNIGNIYSLQDSCDKALEYYLMSLKIDEELSDKNGIAYDWANIASLHLILADSCKNDRQRIAHYNEAVKYGLKSLNLAKEIKVVPVEKDAANCLMSAYKKLENYKKSVEYAEIFIATKDSLFKEEKTNAIAGAEAKWQNEKKQNEIELLNKDKELQNIEVRSQKVQKYAFIGAFALMLVLALVILKSYRDKRKANILLTQQKHEIGEKNEELNQQKEEITAQADQLALVNTELEKLSIVASETDNAVIIADSSGKIEWVNQASVNLYGSSVLELIGKNFVESSSNPDIQSYILKCITEKTSVKYESVTTYGSKKLFTQTTLSPVVDSQGNILKLVAIDSDITEIKEAKEKLERQNTQIIDSINFAKLIQEAILPSDEMIKKAVPESFVFYKPKDIVSGDFYWMHNDGGKILFALVDCTGHGVPGALMSMIGNALLNEIVKGKKVYEPMTILRLLNIEVNSFMSQGGQSYDAGMDITIVCINHDTGSIQIGLAGHTIYCLRNKELTEIDGTFATIGGVMSERSGGKYKTSEIKIEKDLILYMASDGFTDQFGGTDNMKFNTGRFKQMLEDIAGFDMKKQEETVASRFNEWMGKYKQIDDVTILGLRL